MRIGYYAHHHGSGHCRQADKLAAWLKRLGHDSGIENDNLLTVFTSASEGAYSFRHIAPSQVVRLAPEDECSDDILPGRAGAYWQPACLHYSPVGSTDIQSRSLTILEQIAARKIQLMIIDLSVEVALLCRTASIPYLYMRLPGERDDLPHVNAFAGAIGLLAAYPQCIEAPQTPEWIHQKTLYLGFLTEPEPPESKVTRQDFVSELTQYLTQAGAQEVADCEVSGLVAHRDVASNGEMPINNNEADGKDKSDEDSFKDTYKGDYINQQSLASRLNAAAPIITVIKGFGGHARIDEQLAVLRQAIPEALIISLGPIAPLATPNVDIATQVTEVKPYLQHSDLLVMACGLNAIGEASQVATPLVVIPDDRPHREQEMMAEGLIACGRAMSWQGFLAQLSESKVDQLAATASAASKQSDDKLAIHKVAVDKVAVDKMSIDKMAIDKLPTPSAELQDQLNQTMSDAFIESLAKAVDTKTWFYEWLLPHLGIAPERLL